MGPDFHFSGHTATVEEGLGSTAGAILCVMAALEKTASGNVRKEPTKEVSFWPAVSRGGCSTSGCGVKRPGFQSLLSPF